MLTLSSTTRKFTQRCNRITHKLNNNINHTNNYKETSILRRNKSSSTTSKILISGKTNNLLGFWLKYRSIITIGVGTTVVTLTGGWALYHYWRYILSVIGISAVGIIGTVLYIRAKRLRPYPILVKEIQKRRSDIEKVIGAFELPPKYQVSISPSKTPLTNRQKLDFTLGINGTRGTAHVTLRMVQIPSVQPFVHPYNQPNNNNKWEVEKLRIEMQGIEGSDTLSESRDLSTPNYVDSGVIVQSSYYDPVSKKEITRENTDNGNKNNNTTKEGDKK